MNRFTGRTVLITGGTSGMGLATAHRLVAEGAHAVVTGRTRARVDSAVQEVGPAASGTVADVARPRRGGRTGGDRPGPPRPAGRPLRECGHRHIPAVREHHRAGLRPWRRRQLQGRVLHRPKALPLLADGGSIAINASWTLHRGNSVLTSYPAAKAAVHNLARTLAAALAPRGIRVDSVSPGCIDTPRTR